MEGRFKAVGFDMDGTFLRTRVDYVKLGNVDREVAERHGVAFDEIDFGTAVKRPRAPIGAWLEAHGRGGEWPAIYREIDELSTVYECEFVDEAVPFPGAVRCFEDLRSRGLKVGILTRGSLEYARRALGPLFGEFDFVMGRDYSNYDDAKPSPVAMRQFAAELGVDASELLYVGDNTTDWESAAGAGSAFVGVLTGASTLEVWKAADPSMTVVDSVADIPGLF
ncbi:MAG: HAD-IA family hydrolase [Thermoplasmata archaeon]|nr:HAD-IA family hydrolase [Thermoplasmata archaeon]